ncbi:hypothetical protein NADFUDRAFT_25742 [Nadsonia fulvescens var. elongata DSM 6958]|uniref:AMMECR1 domain-containing protein n=1 Tax=Nadsonia fulvescens var. elongata DSM 6958 TaxID=857566 RepID=A0A1E3PIA3_9ASCO|nr:hypothetical protein NADFUDRAFT_25742 [Nadsonia fulvescens var. elongata DSM 6958]
MVHTVTPSPYACFAFEVIVAKLKAHKPKSLSKFIKACKIPKSELVTQPSCPLFVTWEIGPNEDLRGCIGTFTNIELEQGIKRYAAYAAFEDSRFSPIQVKHLSELKCDVTILTDFETCNDAYDWTVGVHGIRINFLHLGKTHSATFLPSVAIEHEWDQEETLMHLVRKSGCKVDHQTIINMPSFHISRYQGRKHGASWSDYEHIINN